MTKASTDNQPGSPARVTIPAPHPRDLLARNLELAWRIQELQKELTARTKEVEARNKEVAAHLERKRESPAGEVSAWWIVAAFLLGLALILTVLIACEVVRRG